MRVLYVDCPPELIEDRRRKGLDHLDEVWEGVYHVAPAPGQRHQDIVLGLAVLLKQHLADRARVCLGCNVREPGSGASNFRIPDLSIVSEARASILAEEDDFIDGGPDAVIEVRSKGDESYEKLPFYAKLDVREVVVVDAVTRAPEVFRLRGGHYYAVAADGAGWLASEVLSLRLRAGERDGKPCLLAAPASAPDRVTAI